MRGRSQRKYARTITFEQRYGQFFSHYQNSFTLDELRNVRFNDKSETFTKCGYWKKIANQKEIKTMKYKEIADSLFYVEI